MLNHFSRRRLRSLSAAVLILALLFSCILPAAADNVWRIGTDTEILFVSGTPGDVPETQIRLFAAELAEKVTGTAPEIRYNVSSAGNSGDILLSLDAAHALPAEGYRISLSGGCVTIAASDADGLFYGCRNLIRQLLADGTVTAKESSPDTAERGLSLDCGRKYYTVDWIKQMIRELSWANMNTLVLHFSEEMGFGIESRLYPWLAGRDGTLGTQAEAVTDSRVLTYEDIAEIVKYAELYHVDIVPSLDSPGHVNYIVKKFNEQCADKDFSFTFRDKVYTAKAGSVIGNYFHYNGQTAIVQGTRNRAYSLGVDISDETAAAFMQSLIEEYALLFRSLGCTEFDIGGDELLGWGNSIDWRVPKWQQLDHWKAYAQNRAKAEGRANYADAVAYDAFMYYMNDLYDLVTGLGYTSVRMWNDDALRSADTGWKRVVELNKNIDIWFWTTGANTAKDYIDAGYEVYNILCDYNYYALTFNYFSGSRELFIKASPETIYREWNPYIFDPANGDPAAAANVSAGNPAVLGSSFAIWCDHPDLKTEAEVMAEVLPMLRAHAVKAWDADANALLSYSDFVKLDNLFGSAPDASQKLPPVTPAEPVPEPSAVPAEEPPAKESGRGRTGRLFIKA